MRIPLKSPPPSFLFFSFIFSAAAVFSYSIKIQNEYINKDIVYNNIL